MITATGPGFVPPAQYSGIWNLIAILIVIGAILIVVAVVRLTRLPRPQLTSSDLDPMPAIDREGLRQRYLALIDAAESEHDAGRMPARDLHQRMSSLVREFAFEVDGIRAQSMTLTDLRAARNDSLGDVVARLYPGEFSAIERGIPAESVELARRVVRRWN